MKKYVSPNSEIITLGTEHMIATSLQTNEGNAEQWSHSKNGWNSDDWSGEEDEL